MFFFSKTRKGYILTLIQQNYVIKGSSIVIMFTYVQSILDCHFGFLYRLLINIMYVIKIDLYLLYWSSEENHTI